MGIIAVPRKITALAITVSFVVRDTIIGAGSSKEIVGAIAVKALCAPKSSVIAVFIECAAIRAIHCPLRIAAVTIETQRAADAIIIRVSILDAVVVTAAPHQRCVLAIAVISRRAAHPITITVIIVDTSARTLYGHA
jgi:hypothetical protein